MENQKQYYKDYKRRVKIKRTKTEMTRKTSNNK